MGRKLSIKSIYIDGVYVIEPIVHVDGRGVFTRIFCEDELKEIFKENSIKQVNHSLTYNKGTVRGMHFQYVPNCEIKLVKCISGKVWDIIVDIRKNSPTFLQSFSIELSSENNKILYIPKGFAHGFQSLEDNSELLYFHSNVYAPNNEGALNIRDSLLNINWPLEIIEVSKRDEEHSFIDSDFKGLEI